MGLIIKNISQVDTRTQNRNQTRMRASLFLSIMLMLVSMTTSKYLGEEAEGQLEDDSQDVDLSGLRIMMPVSRMSSLTVPEPGYNMISSRPQRSTRFQRRISGLADKGMMMGLGKRVISDKGMMMGLGKKRGYWPAFIPQEAYIVDDN